MTRRRPWNILGVLAAVSLIGLGILEWIISERVRFDGIRITISRQLDEAAHGIRAKAMALEREVPRVEPPASPVTEAAERAATWVDHLDTMDAAIARRDVSAAERAWRDASAAAVRTRAWRPLVDVGDAALRMGAVDGHRAGSVVRARGLYMDALIRARADRSLEGVVHVAESFEDLGDRAVVEQCLIIAERLSATTDTDALRRLRALANRVPDARTTPRIEP